MHCIHVTTVAIGITVVNDARLGMFVQHYFYLFFHLKGLYVVGSSGTCGVESMCQAEVHRTAMLLLCK